jgi:hypothetical protein
VLKRPPLNSTLKQIKFMKKMMFSLAVFASLAGQTQLSNTVPPSGPVGIGTMSPYPGTQLTVNGVARILNSLTADGVLTANNSAILNSYVRMAGIAAFEGELDDIEILVRTAEGNIVRETVLDFAIGLGKPPEEITYCSDAEIAHPQWFHSMNELFSPCPQVKVGIGTSNPTHNLDVRGTTFTLKLIAGNTPEEANAVINAYAANHVDALLKLGKRIDVTPSEVKLVVENNGDLSTVGNVSAQRLKATDYSNVGGAADPNMMFRVLNYNKNVGLSIENLHDSDGKYGLRITIDRDLTKAINIHNTTTGKDVFRVMGNGHVWATEITVAITDNFPDYVFEKNYPLMPLKEVEQYVAKNKRLPGIKPATEIEKDGLNVGKMQVQQMEKIEEIYLYLFDIEKRLVELEKENIQLKNQVQQLKRN